MTCFDLLDGLEYGFPQCLHGYTLGCTRTGASGAMGREEGASGATGTETRGRDDGEVAGEVIVERLKREQGGRK